MIRIALVLVAVLSVGMIEVPPLLKGPRRPLITVSALLLCSLVSGLLIVTMPEGASVAKFLIHLISPIGETLLGPM
ncbi:MAG: hypothetical protein K0R39_5117 [Symbiobacteriaceae bacterium]|jgi:hypothetical protein|nr:hypothetical protein [Symbiobacteriaceae bacterium]